MLCWAGVCSSAGCTTLLPLLLKLVAAGGSGSGVVATHVPIIQLVDGSADSTAVLVAGASQPDGNNPPTANCRSGTRSGSRRQAFTRPPLFGTRTRTTWLNGYQDRCGRSKTDNKRSTAGDDYYRTTVVSKSNAWAGGTERLGQNWHWTYSDASLPDSIP